MIVSREDFDDYTKMYLTFNNFQIQYIIRKIKKDYNRLYFWIGLITMIGTITLAIVYDIIQLRMRIS